MEILEVALLRGGGYSLPLPALWTCLAILVALFVLLLRSRAVVTGSTKEVLRAPPSPPPAADTSEPTTDVAPEATAVMGVCRKEVLFVGVYGENDDDDDDERNHDDCRGHDDGQNHNHDGGVDDGGGGMGEWKEEYLGWYRYQDMAAIDGSVVRLWEDERRRRTMVTPPFRKRLSSQSGEYWRVFA